MPVRGDLPSHRQPDRRNLARPMHARIRAGHRDDGLSIALPSSRDIAIGVSTALVSRFGKRPDRPRILDGLHDPRGPVATDRRSVPSAAILFARGINLVSSRRIARPSGRFATEPSGKPAQPGRRFRLVPRLLHRGFSNWPVPVAGIEDIIITLLSSNISVSPALAALRDAAREACRRSSGICCGLDEAGKRAESGRQCGLATPRRSANVQRGIACTAFDRPDQTWWNAL
jgi:hypothetical protein